MSTESQQQQGEIDDPFASLSPYEFVLLTTFRASGVGVPTAMWFAHEHEKLYLVTGRTTGKLKRIRMTSRVLVAPCDLWATRLGHRSKRTRMNSWWLSMRMPMLS